MSELIRKIWKFFTSVKLTVVLFVLLLIPSIIGTVIQQNAPDPNQYVQIYGPTWDRIFRFLGFYDIYHDSRFILLLILLGLNTFACTVSRFKLRWNRIGAIATHLGLLLILIGALTGAFFGMKGFMRIAEGQTTDEILVNRADRKTDRLHFHVRLEDFIFEVYEERAGSLIVFDAKSGKQQRHKIEEGTSVPLSTRKWFKPLSLLGLKPRAVDLAHVGRIYSDAALETALTEGPEQTGIRAAEFRIVGPATEKRGFALSQMARPFVFEDEGIAVGYSELQGETSLEEILNRARSLSKVLNRLEVRIPEKNIRQVYEAEVGASFRIEGADYTVEVLRYVPDFVIDVATRDIASRSDVPRNPALQIRLTGPTGSKERWLFSKFPEVHTASSEPFSIRFLRDDRLGDARDYVLAVKPSEGNPVVAHFRDGVLVETVQAKIAEPIKIAGIPHRLVIDRFFENANMENKLVNRPEGVGRPAVEISIDEDGSERNLVLWERTPVDIEGYRMVYVREERPKGYYSVLQVVKNGIVVAQKKIGVNDPLRYDGYTFYQSSYDSENLAWSGLQVKKDPGVPLVYAGFSMQILGMVIIFYINPLLRKRGKPRASAEVSPTLAAR